MIKTQIDGRSSRAILQRERRKAQILEAAEKVIGKKGFYATSIDDVIEISGISRGTFYLYFESRELLFQEILDRFIQKLKASIKPVRLEDPVGHLDKLYANFSHVLKLLFEHKDLTIILFREAIVHGGIVHEKLQELDLFFQRMIIGALRNGHILGITRQVNEHLVAMAIIGGFKEIIYHYLSDEKLKNASYDQMILEMIDFLFRGLSPTQKL